MPYSWWQDYRERLKSPDWKERRKRMIRECGGGCERCFLITDKLELHHKTYERLWDELDSDLEVLCEKCHKIADAERQAETEDRLHNARLNGWARKKYGEDWASYEDIEEVEEEFYRWVERKQGY